MSKYEFILIPIIVLILSQSIKCIIESINQKNVDIYRFFDGSGGMPSSHSATVSSLTTLVGLKYGISSTLFAVCLIFSLIILYDAKGVRYETGKQATVLNKMIKKDKKLNKEFLKEKIGHKPIEVFFGALLGTFVSIILYYAI